MEPPLTPSNVALLGERIRKVLPTSSKAEWMLHKDIVEDLFLGLELYAKGNPTYRFVIIRVDWPYGGGSGPAMRAIGMRIRSRSLPFPDSVVEEALNMNALYQTEGNGKLVWGNWRLKAEKYVSTEEDVLQYLTSSHKEIREYGTRLLERFSKRH
jgi:hypothetical protein